MSRRFGIYDGGNWSAFAGRNRGAFGTVPAKQDTWTFVAVVYDQPQSMVTLYVDGDVYIKDNTNLETGESTLRIGSNPGFGEYFSGIIDEVFIFNKALTREQLDTIRQNGVSAMK